MSVPTTIRSLGWLDAEGDGLTATHRIGLWSVATQALLATATVTPDSRSRASAHGTARWFMAGIPDVVLAPGTYRVAGEVNGDNIALSDARVAGPNTTLTAGYVRTDFPNGGFAYPDLTFGSNAVRATVSTDAVVDLLVDAGPAATIASFATGNYVAGTEFTVSVPTTIRSLGYLDAQGDGLGGSHRIGLWNATTQALIRSVTVKPTSTPFPSANGTARWFMARIRDVELAPGTYRIAGEVAGDEDVLANDRLSGANTTLTSGYVRTDFPSGGFAFPGLSFGSQAVRVTACTQAVTDLIVDAGPNSVTSSFTTGNYVAGTEFTLSEPTTIRSLGWLDAEGDGLTATHRVGLWSVATQTLLREATVTPSSTTIASSHGTAQWFLAPITPITLAPGTYRVAGEVSGDNIALADEKLPGPNTTLTAGYIRTDFPNGGFAYPNLTFASDAVRATASRRAVGAPCYANCDNSTSPPILNVNDFICFQAAFAAGAAYANCDNSTQVPVLNVNDFICFQSAFAAGCP